MITQIQLGNIFSQGDKTVLAGGNTGLDVESLIDSLAEAKRLPAVVLEGKIEENALKSDALSEMRSLLESFKDASNFLRNPPGVQNDADNIFEYRAASIASNTSVSGDTYLSVTAAPGASIAEYEMEVTQLATRSLDVTSTFAVADADTSIVDGGGALNSGVLTLGASAESVTLDAGDTLNQVVAKVNAVSEQSGVEAAAIKVSDGNYRISFKTVETGSSQNFDIAALNPGVFNVGFAINDNALDAQIEFDGTTITRETNNIDDIVDDVTFSLLQETPGGTTLDVGVDADRELAKQGILNFVDSYNALRLFASRQSEVGDNGLPVEDAALSGNATMRLTMSRVMQEMSQAVAGIASGDASRLSDLGITFSDFPGDEETPFTRNIITVDEDTLDSVLAADFDEVRNVFEFDFNSDDPDLQVFSRTNALDATSLSLNIDQTNGVFEATYDPGTGPITVNLDKEDLGSGSIVLSGQDGTELEGLVMIYSSTADSTANVNLSQGLADRIFNTMEGLLEEETGALDVEITNLDDETTRFGEEISRIDSNIERFRLRLLEQFSALESAISQANTLLQTLDAQASARASA